MNMSKMIGWVIGIVLCVCSTSCRHKDLYMDEPMSQRVVVIFDWQQAPDANPESMAMYLYDGDRCNPLRYIFSNAAGGEIKAPFGTHHALCMNADNTSWVHLRNIGEMGAFEVATPGTDELTAQGLATRGLPRADSAEEERLVVTPDMLWGDRSENISLIPHNGADTVYFHPRELVCHYIVDVYQVENLRGVASTDIDASLSGMAEAVNVNEGVGSDTPVTMTMSLRSNSVDSSLHGEFLTFGECSNRQARHFLTVYTVLTDGSKWYKSFDVTDQVSNAPDPRHVHIVVSGLPLPEPPEGGSGTSIRPNVNEWQPVNIDMKM